MSARQRLSGWLRGFGLRSFSRGHYRIGRHAFEAHLALDGEETAAGRFDKASDHEIGDFLSRRMADWRAGAVAAPVFCREQLPEIDLSGVRMLVVVSKYINNDPSFLENEMSDHLLATARNAGMQADVFYCDDCSYPELLGVRPNAKEALAAFRRKVIEARPDILFLDANFIGTPDSINREVVNDLKRQAGTTVIGFIGDAWMMPQAGRLADYWIPTCDAIYHHTPETPLNERHAGKLILSAYPTNRKRFYPEKQRGISVSFLGSTPPMRAYMVASVREIGLSDSVLVGHNRNGGQAAPSRYADVMRRSEIVLDFSGAKHPRVNGRVFQSLNSGCLLLAEENGRKTEAFFVPYVHYVPFANARELRRLVRFFASHREHGRAIGEAAARWCDRYYTEKRIWSDIIGQVGRIKAEL